MADFSAGFNKTELLKVAKLSALNLSDSEIEIFTNNLEKVLNFIDQIKEVKVSAQVDQVRNKNILREDEVVPTDSTDILNLAHEKQESYFVVPKILDENKGTTC
ncbi:MAG: Asp-tRNA(Asn)/Glu-tRNA(Gln) amidotransferase subunit GatC [Candidatus Babeliales bacterium]|jgi:aspartyl-tRNA(Asn)/glutamyl-tRNA(Gln) amidotransferase subunit C|nr:MAG: Aspartyl/glutamyl-tRNA(Asn/Gln) amidotransferase subunit C [candidate division TM6 bacterium GW2011_GWF2_36_6]